MTMRYSRLTRPYLRDRKDDALRQATWDEALDRESAGFVAPRSDDATIERIEAAFELTVRGVRPAWAGLRTFTPYRVPVAGPDPEDTSFVWLAGQGGYCVKPAPALARLTAALALDDAVPRDLAQCGVEAADLAPGRLFNTIY